MVSEDKTSALEKTVEQTSETKLLPAVESKPGKVGFWDAFLPKEKRKNTIGAWLLTIASLAAIGAVTYFTTPQLVQYSQDQRAAENKRQIEILARMPLHKVDTRKDGASIYGIMYNCFPETEKEKFGINRENFRAYFKIVNELGFGENSDNLQKDTFYCSPCANNAHKKYWINEQSTPLKEK